MKPWLKILLILLFLGIIAAVLVYFFIYNKPHPDYTAAMADFRLPAAELYQSFKERTEESAKTYNGKVIEITGVPTKVDANDSLVTVVFVFSQGMFGDEGIRCSMHPGFFDQARNLASGTTCTIKGFCSGFNDTDVILESCSIIK